MPTPGGCRAWWTAARKGAEIPPYRMILHAPQVAAGIPLLGGVARSALWAWVFKRSMPCATGWRAWPRAEAKPMDEADLTAERLAREMERMLARRAAAGPAPTGQWRRLG